MRISYKNTLDPNFLDIKESIKNKETGEWECELLYKGEKLIVNTPKAKVDDNILIFDSIKRQAFLEFVSKLEEIVVDYIAENSSKIFKGKKFSKNRIKDSIVPSVYIDDSSLSYIQTTEYPELKCFNFFLDNIKKEELEEEITAEIIVDSIVFCKELFRIDYKILKLKNSKVKFHKDLDFNSEKELVDGDFFE